jgi:7,8-dihydropterin-6-yl-methyl-4-(beta-D-ribofuranosyl)aminobenzene 5'-phosphate synthase
MKKEIKISILCEDQAKMGFLDKPFLAQHGFSVFIEAGLNILFDTGATDVFIHNARLLGIDLNTTDWIVLSHGHWDHTNGLASLHTSEKKNLLVHPAAFVDRRRSSGEYNGIYCSRDEIAEKFHLIPANDPYPITDSIYYLGEIPRLNDFESQKTAFFYVDQGKRYSDFILDDTALAIETERGLVIITGCSHAGICNIVEYAKQVTCQDNVFAVLGGFHLLGDSVQLQKTVEYFKKDKIEYLYPMHCTDLASLSKFHQTFGMNKLCAGDTIILNTE